MCKRDYQGQIREKKLFIYNKIYFKWMCITYFWMCQKYLFVFMSFKIENKCVLSRNDFSVILESNLTEPRM